ncbi:MAG: tyrosine-type recombinase/integrase [Thermoanaerobaculia bacterium]
MTREEVGEIFRRVDGVPWLALTLLYGTGMRLMECLRLRVQDIDFSQNEITIREQYVFRHHHNDLHACSDSRWSWR